MNKPQSLEEALVQVNDDWPGLPDVIAEAMANELFYELDYPED